MRFRKNTIAIDANIILRYFLKDNENFYNSAESFFKDVYAGKKVAYVFQVVIAEVIYVLTKFYKIDKLKVADAIEDFLSNKNIKSQDKEIILEAITIFRDKNIDFADCLLCAYSRQISVFSFDKKVNKCLYEQDNLTKIAR